jgi:hypothetical protein
MAQHYATALYRTNGKRRPVVEWALRWLEANRPAGTAPQPSTQAATSCRRKSEVAAALDEGDG